MNSAPTARRLRSNVYKGKLLCSQIARSNETINYDLPIYARNPAVKKNIFNSLRARKEKKKTLRNGCV